ncbi:MAG: insulinase family protein, partial [Spirochaetota bacterium]
DPEVIPELSYETFRAFWEEHYHPSNCKVFFHGNMDLGSQLAFLEEKFLASFDSRAVATEVPVQARFDAPRRVDLPYPVAEGAEASVQIVVNWLTTEITDEVESFGLELLAEILMGHDGAPLSAALRTSDLGEDLSPQCGLDTVFRQVIFSAGLRGTEQGREAAVEDLVISTIRDFVSKGIPAKAREAALHSIAFANREIRRGSASYGLRLLFRSLRGWLHGAGPEATLSFVKVLEGYEKAVAAEPLWLEKLADKWLVSNPHRSTVTVHPEQGLFEKKRRESERLLEERERALTEAERGELRRTQAALEALQGAPDSEEALACLPMLRVADLPGIIDVIAHEKGSLLGLGLSSRPLFTNGIVYLELAFPLDRVPREAQVWLPFFSRFVSGAGLPGRPWGEVAEALALYAGGFGASLDAGRMASAPGRTSPQGAASDGLASFLLVRVKALGDRFQKALELTLGLLAGADTDDRARVGDLLAELGNDISSAIVPAGNSFALARAGASWSEALAIEESWRGTSQVRFVKSLRADMDLDR